MLKCERDQVMNFEAAIRGARNPMNSWSKSDSVFFVERGDDVHGDYYKTINSEESFEDEEFKSYKIPLWADFVIGPNDLDLLQRLVRSGTDHRKFMRQILVSVDITAPLYWWKEYDTYKVSTVANSTSTMHKIHAKEFELDDFSHDHLTKNGLVILESVVTELEGIRLKYMATGKPKELWYDMIQLLPSSYNQMRTCTLNYETLLNIYHARKNHKLEEWHTLCRWIESLPYAKELIVNDYSCDCEG